MVSGPAEGGAGAKDVKVLPGDEVAAEALAEFYRKSWSPEAEAEQVRRSRAEAARANPVEPGVTPADVAYLVDGEVVGYLGSIPVRFWDGATEAKAHWLKGFQVLPEFRNGPVGFYLLRTMNRRLGLAGSLLVAEPARKLLETVGYTHVGALSDRILVLRGGRVLGALRPERIPGLPASLRRVVTLAQRLGVASLGGAAASGTLAFHRAVLRRLRARGLRVSRERPSREEMDALWALARPGLEAAPVRDGVHLLWRYAGKWADRYAFVAVRSGSELAGVAILKLPTDSQDPRLEGIRMATLSDIVVPPDRRDVALALLCGVADAAREAGADALLAGSTHPSLGRALARTGFAKVAENLHFYLRTGPSGPELPMTIQSWWLTRGDCGADLGL